MYIHNLLEWMNTIDRFSMYKYIYYIWADLDTVIQLYM